MRRAGPRWAEVDRGRAFGQVGHSLGGYQAAAETEDDATAGQDDEDTVDVESSGPEAEDGGDIDEQDGVRTNSFNAMPSELGDMHLVSSESDPSEHIIQVDYMATDEESRMLFMAYMPGTEGDGYTPVSSHSDPGFRSAVDSGKQHSEEEGFDVTSRSAATDGYDWECFEALQTQSGGIDHSLCLTTGYGRVIEIQRLALHDPDEQARNSHMDDLLGEVSSAIANIES